MSFEKGLGNVADNHEKKGKKATVSHVINLVVVGATRVLLRTRFRLIIMRSITEKVRPAK